MLDTWIARGKMDFLQMASTYFVFSCKNNDMQSCSSNSFNNIFCSDIIAILDKMCSGRTSCEVAVNALVFETKPCPMELRSYLQASYICIPGR